jgi:hypothetical protein
MKNSVISYSFLLALILTACSITSGPSTATKTSLAIPYPESKNTKIQAYTAPYPIPEPAALPGYPTSVVVPTPGKDTGVLIGYLTQKGKNLPITFKTIKLGDIVYLTPGPAYTYRVYEHSSPEGFTDKDGRFAIGNIPPGKYLVFLWSPQSLIVVPQPNSNEALWVTIGAGKTLDVGKLEVELK